MFGIQDFAIFLTASIVLNLTPGPDTFYILGRGLAQGRAAAVASALGISIGSLIHTIFAAIGLSALIAASSVAFTAVKLAGALYLICLGLRMLLSTTRSAATQNPPAPATFKTILIQGIITNVLNPKVALFFLAFMPQFISPAAPSRLLSFLALGITFVITGTIWCLCLAAFSHAIASKIQADSPLSKTIHRAVGALFITLGLRLATSK